MIYLFLLSTAQAVQLTRELAKHEVKIALDFSASHAKQLQAVSLALLGVICFAYAFLIMYGFIINKQKYEQTKQFEKLLSQQKKKPDRSFEIKEGYESVVEELFSQKTQASSCDSSFSSFPFNRELDFEFEEQELMVEDLFKDFRILGDTRSLDYNL